MMEVLRGDALLNRRDHGLPRGEENRGEDALLGIKAGGEGAVRLRETLASGESEGAARGSFPRGFAR